MNKIKKSRCSFCGRFIKGGLWNFMNHLEVCPGSPNVYRGSTFSLEDFQSVVRSSVGRAARS